MRFFVKLKWVVEWQGAGGDEYTVYIHARPGFVYTKNNTQCSSFIDRQLKNPVLVHIINFITGLMKFVGYLQLDKLNAKLNDIMI